MDKNSKKQQSELPNWLTDYIKEQLLPEYFPKGITLKDLKDIKLLFEVKRMMDNAKDIVGEGSQYIYKQLPNNEPQRISIESIREKAMKIDADELEAMDILELGRMFYRLDRLNMAEMVDDLERKQLWERLNHLEKLVAEKQKSE